MQYFFTLLTILFQLTKFLNQYFFLSIQNMACEHWLMLFPCILEMLVNRKNVLSSKSFYTPADFSPFMNSAERCALILPAGFGIPASWRGENLTPLLPLSLFLLFFLSFPPLPLCRCVFRFVLVSTTSVHRLAEFCCQYSSRGCVCVCALTLGMDVSVSQMRRGVHVWLGW